MKVKNDYNECLTDISCFIRKYFNLYSIGRCKRI